MMLQEPHVLTSVCSKGNGHGGWRGEQILKGLLVTKNKGMLPPVGDRKPMKNSDQGDGVKYACCSWFLLFIILEVEAGVQEE